MQFNCAKIKANSPTTKALGTEKKMTEEVKSSYLPVYHFIGIIWQQYIHRSPRKSSETNSGWFLKVRSCLLVCPGIITLYCIVWVAILFPVHPYIESAQRRSDTLDLVYEFTLNCILDTSLILKLPILERDRI